MPAASIGRLTGNQCNGLQRDAINGTTFKFTVANATIRNFKSAPGYSVSGKRTDGNLRLTPAPHTRWSKRTCLS